MSFRPELKVDGKESFIHNSRASSAAYEADENIRPQVVAMHAWGAQTQTGGWDYLETPEASRARGGTARGGVLLVPPEFEMEDYLGLSANGDVHPDLPSSFLTVAPGVGFALGTPNAEGSLNPKSVTLVQDLGNSNDAVGMYQLDANGTGLALLYGEVDQTTSEVVVEIGTGGHQAIRIPSGTTAQRPSALAPIGGELRMNTDVSSAGDVPEYYNAATSTWQQLAGGLLTASINASDVFTFRHARGSEPHVQVVDSSGIQIEVGVTHVSSDMVSINFSGTITNGVLILS